MFDTPWAWTETCQVSFKKMKELLLNSPLMAHYDPNKPVRLAVDASSYGLGAVLSHVFDDGEEKPIAYASRSLSASEQNYSMIEKDALAIVFGIKKFGRRFSLLTDHRPLTLLLGPKRGIPVLAASRLQRWTIQLSAYQHGIEYWASKDHANADALPRLPRKTVEDLMYVLESKETSDHFFYNCSHTRQFWTDFASYWHLLSKHQIHLSLKDVLFGIFSEKNALYLIY